MIGTCNRNICILNVLIRGVARTVVMCRHLNENVGFTEAHWGKDREGVTPSLGRGGGSRGPLEKFLKNNVL